MRRQSNLMDLVIKSKEEEIRQIPLIEFGKMW